MFREERKKDILNTLIENNSVMVSDLAKKYFVADETIRRDLNELEMQGVALRTHGGAVLSEQFRNEMPDIQYSIREQINVKEKMVIGQLAVGLVEDGDTLLLDGSTTCLYFAKALPNTCRITVITYSLAVVNELKWHKNITLVILGGVLRAQSNDMYGDLTEMGIDHCSWGKTVFSSSGFDPVVGATGTPMYGMTLRKLSIGRARTRIYLCDHTKLGKIDVSVSAALNQIEYFVTDRPIQADWVQTLERQGIHFIWPGRETALH